MTPGEANAAIDQIVEAMRRDIDEQAGESVSLAAALGLAVVYTARTNAEGVALLANATAIAAQAVAEGNAPA